MNDSQQDQTQPQNKVLVVEEETSICKLFKLIFSKNGIKAITVNDPDAAIRQYMSALETGQPFRTVFLDLKIAGEIVAINILEKLEQIDPNVNAVVLSGDIYNKVMVNFDQYGFKAALPKPCERKKLISSVFV